MPLNIEVEFFDRDEWKTRAEAHWESLRIVCRDRDQYLAERDEAIEKVKLLKKRIERAMIYVNGIERLNRDRHSAFHDSPTRFRGRSREEAALRVAVLQR